MRTPTPEVEYVHKVGQVVFMVAYVEGMLIHDLPRFQTQNSAPPELDLLKVTGMTTRNLGDYIAAHAPNCTDPSSPPTCSPVAEPWLRSRPNAMACSMPDPWKTATIPLTRCDCSGGASKARDLRTPRYS